MLMCIKDGHAALQKALIMLVCPDPLRNGYYFSNVNQREGGDGTNSEAVCAAAAIYHTTPSPRTGVLCVTYVI